MTSPSPTIDSEKLCRLIETRTGLITNVHQCKDVLEIANDLAASTEIPSNGDWLTALTDTPLTHPIWQRIIRLTTVGETYFFRNQAQFDALRSHILPDLIEERRRSGNKHLRLWSAGSATGEEPYSLAMLLRELLPDIETWNITLLATDINENYLEYARKGIYGARSFRSETPDRLKRQWFTPEQDRYRLMSIVRNMVVFGLLNLVSDEYPTFASNTMYMDVILCRNVTIYFDRDTTRLVAEHFYRTLNRNGWLIVGHAEPQSELYQGFASRNFKNTVVYQKNDLESSEVPETEAIKLQPALVLPPLPPRPNKNKLPPREPRPPQTLPEDFWGRAKAAADLESWDEARGWLDKAEQHDPLQPQIHYLRALVELHNGNVDQGLHLLRRSVYCDASFALAHYVLGDLYQLRGARKAALRHWQFALNAIENSDAQQLLPYSDDLTVEMLAELLATRLSH